MRRLAPLVVPVVAVFGLVVAVACSSDDGGGGPVPIGSACSSAVALACPAQASACRGDAACTACEGDVSQPACQAGLFASLMSCACGSSASSCATECDAHDHPVTSGGSSSGVGGATGPSQ